MPSYRNGRGRPRSTAAAPLRSAIRPVIEPLGRRLLLSGSTPQAQPAAWHVQHDTLAMYVDFTDATARDTHTATINWGDNTPTETLLLDEPGASPVRPDTGTAYGLHAYAEPGTRTITVTLTDTAGHTTTQQFTALVGQAADAPFVGPTVPNVSTPDSSSDGFAATEDGETASTAESFTLDTTPPQVSRVFLDRSTWTTAFRDHLAATGAGSSTLGFAVPAGADQLKPLPWMSLDRTHVQFTEDVTVQQSDLRLLGVTVPQYAFASFSYNPTTFTATWTPSTPLANDRLLIDLSGYGAVADAAGNALDGEFTTAYSAFPSGDGMAGGDFEFRFDVLPGDVDRNGAVNIFDTLAIRNREGTSTTSTTSTTSPGTAPNTYTAHHDVDGDGAVTATDVVLTRDAQGTTLPGGTPGGSEEPAPSNLSATAANANRVDLTWTDNGFAEIGFKLERATSSNFASGRTEFILPANATSYQDSDLTPGTTYYYRIRGFDESGDTAYSNTATVTTPAAPAAPSGLTAAAVGTGRINLAWADNSADEDGFRVERATNVNFWDVSEVATLGANATSFSDTGVASNTTYYYRVRSYKGPNSSAPSNVASATTAAATAVPAAPSGLVAVAVASGAIELSWTDASGNEDNFIIERSADGGATWAQLAEVSRDTTEFSDSGLSPSTTYSYRTAARNSAGTSGYSNVASIKTFAADVVPPLEIAAGNVGGDSIGVGWIDNNFYESGYTLWEYGGPGGPVAIDLPANSEGLTRPDREHGTFYSYAVQASDAEGNDSELSVRAMAYFNDFTDGNAGGWSGGQVFDTASANDPHLTPEVYYKGEGVITFTIDNLPEGSWVEGGFNLYILNDWNGNGNEHLENPSDPNSTVNPEVTPDEWTMTLSDGGGEQELLKTTFSNDWTDNRDGGHSYHYYQAYPGGVDSGEDLPRGGSVGGGNYDADGLAGTPDGYPFFSPHIADTMYWIPFAFYAESTSIQVKLKGPGNKSFGVDNTIATVRDVTITIPGGDLWWFGGENAANYAEQRTFRVVNAPPRPPPTAPLQLYTWEVVAGNNVIDLDYVGRKGDKHEIAANTGDGSVIAIATAASQNKRDVTVRLSARGINDAPGQAKVLDEFKFTVFSPAKEEFVSRQDSRVGASGWQTVYISRILDQFGSVLPRAIEMNETFGEWTKQNDRYNWPPPIPDENGSMEDPRAADDTYSYFTTTRMPETTWPDVDGAGDVVMWATQTYRAGSREAGKGIVVKRHRLTYHRGYARQTEQP